MFTSMSSPLRSDLDTATRVTFRTEDGCEVSWPTERVIKCAKRWTPHAVNMKPAGAVALNDYIETARGWSSVVEITR